MVSVLEKYPKLTIAVTLLLMLVFSVQYLEVTIMEARNFITAREMITDGNWLLTTMNGEPRYQKPPLPTWLAAISALLFGIKSVFAYRLPGIIMTIVLSITVYLLSLELIGSKSKSLINGLVAATSFYVVAIVIEAPWDIFTHGFMLLGILNLFMLFQKQQGYWKHTLLAGLFIGLSILCKGPVSFYALLLPFLISYGVTYKFKNFKSKAFSYFSLLIIALVIGGWWYLYVRIQDPDTFLAITNKETGNWSSYNVRPFYYYWSFFTQSGIWTIPAFIGLLYPYMKSRVAHLKAYKFSFYWVLISVILLSIIPEKKSRYLMPVLIPLAINTGFYLDYIIRKFRDIKDKKETIPVYFNFGLIAIIGIAFGIGGYLFLKDTTNINWVLFVIAALVLLGIGISILRMLQKKELKSVFYLIILFVVAAYVFVLPLSSSLKSSQYRPITELNAIAEKEGVFVFSLDYAPPEMIWQFGDKITPLKTNGWTVYPNLEKMGILASELDEDIKANLEPLYTIEEKETYDLNIASPDSRQYRKRLKRTFYLLTKK